MKPSYCWMNRSLVPWTEGTIHVSTEAVLRGASVFEGIRVYRGDDGRMLLFRAHDHLRRLFDVSLRFMRLDAPYSQVELGDAIASLLSANKVKRDAHIRVVVYVDELRLGQELQAGTGAFILASEDVHPAKDALHVTLSPWRRLSDLSMPPRVKAGANYLNSRLAATDAQRKGFDSAIMLNDSGKVSEGPAMNVFIVRDGCLVTPPIGDGILEGITRDTVMQIARRHSLELRERSIDPSELFIADEIFFCGTAYEVVPVVRLDHGPVGTGKPGPITDLVRAEYFKLVRGQVEAPPDWVTPARELLIPTPY